MEQTPPVAGDRRRLFHASWGGRWGLNPRPPDPQSGALPTELRPPSMRLIVAACCSDFHACRRVGHGTGTPGRARTCNPRLRRPMLYPVELRAQSASLPPMTHVLQGNGKVGIRGRGREIRTPDFLLPKQARCQTAPYPAIRLSVALLSARIILAAIWTVKLEACKT